MMIRPAALLRHGIAKAALNAWSTGSGVTWNVSPPFGTEMITIIAAPQRLLQSLRPEIESSQAYLSAL